MSYRPEHKRAFFLGHPVNSYHFDDFVLPRQGGGLDVITLDVPATSPDVRDCDPGSKDDQEQRKEEAESEEKDVVRNIFWLSPRGSATHPVALWGENSIYNFAIKQKV